MPRRSTAIESARSALGWPGRMGTGVRWTVFCDRVRSEGQLREMRPYTDRHIQRVVAQIKSAATPNTGSETDPR